MFPESLFSLSGQLGILLFCLYSPSPLIVVDTVAAWAWEIEGVMASQCVWPIPNNSTGRTRQCKGFRTMMSSLSGQASMLP